MNCLQPAGSEPRRNAGRRLSPIYVDDAMVFPAPAMPRSRRNFIPFGWYGGKFSHLPWLLPQLPEAQHYCEPFAGSAAVLLNRAPAPVETYNDIDGEVVNFFRVLRDQGEELKRTLQATPFSREEFFLACSPTTGLSDAERARRFYIRARQARTGLAQTATLGRWASCNETSRRGMSGSVSRWTNGIEGLNEIAARLRRVQIENRPAVDVIRFYDGPGTLFYCDPPYPHSVRGDSHAYAFEMEDADHVSLAAVLNGCRGRVVLSGYCCDLTERLYAGWRRVDAPVRQCHSAKTLRQESVWMNF